MTAALIASLIAAAISTAGLVLVAAKAEWTQRHAAVFAAFASGALIILSLFHLAPEALSKSPGALVFIAGGLLAGFLLQTVLGAAAGVRGRMVTLGLIPAIGIAVHSFVDGGVYAVTFSADMVTGLLTGLSLMVHEFPEGIIVFVLLTRAGMRARTAFWTALFAASATTPLGVLVSAPFVDRLGAVELGDMLGLSAGLLFYVGAVNLAPVFRTRPARRAWAALAAGGAMALALTLAHSQV